MSCPKKAICTEISIMRHEISHNKPNLKTLVKPCQQLEETQTTPMAAKDTKRKQISSSQQGDKKAKNPKLSSSDSYSKPMKSFRQDKPDQNDPQSNRERRIQAKELAAARKQKRKRHYTLEQELASLWEKMRRRNISKEDRSKLVSEAVQKMKGKICEIAVSHVSSRVLQTCVKYCTQEERDAVFEELRPNLLTLACNTYAVHLVKKMLDKASKKQLEGFISALHGHVASLLRHAVGSVVIEHAYELGNAFQKQSLLLELYSAELQLFKDLVSMKERSLADLIPKLSLNKAAVARHMASVLQPILEKGILDHSITHTALMEYLNIADKSSAADVIEQLAGPLLVRMIHTKDGSKLGILCLKHGGAKERKKVIKGMKDHIGKTARDQYGCMVLVCMLSVVDDTKLLTKIVIRELKPILSELVSDKNGRRPLLQLLHPNCQRYLGSEELASLDLSVPSLCSKSEGTDKTSDLQKQKSSEIDESDDKDDNGPDAILPEDKLQLADVGRKDPSVRRLELLVNSGLAESLVDTCIENVKELLQSNFGKEVIYEVALGGTGGILLPTLSDKLTVLHKAIASLAALPRTDNSGEHVFENFHSSRTIRKLILDCPTFASTLWKKALRGKCDTWAKGHSSKVVSAFLESSDSHVRDKAIPELQPLIDGGILKISKTNTCANEG